MSFITEFKRRNVFKVGAAYAIVGWLLIQVADTLLPAFEAPDWVLRVVALVVILGFPLAILFAWAFELTPEGIRPTREIAPGESIAPQTGLKLNNTILGLLVVAVGFLLLDRYAISGSGETTARVTGVEFETSARVQRSSLVLPQEASIVFGGGPAHSFAISPDGQTIVYVGGDSSEGPRQRRLYVRELDSLTLRELPGTELATQPFFSPDGQWLAFFTLDRELKKISLAGGRPVTLAVGLIGGAFGFGTWLDNQQIVFSHSGEEATIKSVSADGGKIAELLRSTSSSNVLDYWVGPAIPDTTNVLFTSETQVETARVYRVEVLNTATGERRLVLDDASAPHYLDSGHLLFTRDDVPLVAPFDKEALALTGPAMPLADAMRRDSAANRGRVPQLAVSRNGTLAYVPPVNTQSQIHLVDRNGNSEPLDIPPDRYDGVTVSPDGRYAALEIRNLNTSEIQVHDLTRGTATRLSQAESDHSATWHPVDPALVVATREGGSRSLSLKHLNGSTRALVELTPEFVLRNSSWHPDGRQLAVTRQTGGEHDILLLRVADQGDSASNNGGGDEASTVTMEPLLVGPTGDFSPRFSPDGRWLAYVSTRTGDWQVYIQRFPEGENWIVSTGDEAFLPEWSRDGSELYFFQGNSTGEGDFLNMTAVTVSETDSGLEIGAPVNLFPLRTRNAEGKQEGYSFSGINVGHSYGVMPDGRFLMARGASGIHQQEIVLVQNWFSELPEVSAP